MGKKGCWNESSKNESKEQTHEEVEREKALQRCRKDEVLKKETHIDKILRLRFRTSKSTLNDYRP